ncbi:PAS domain S-box protein [Leptolyngbya sp. GB1-A1]|uniref:hybrid sensor histidine kinase/response regulator n=1 Tax=Leptolyngbya sp. GB1-A1 TaxID=2933908 RepID=UPI003299F8C8
MTDPVSQKPFTPPIPANEAERLAALHRYKILDTPPEAAFDRITRLAARLFDMPIALISLLDESRAWFKSCVGFGANEVSRDATLCSFAVLTDEPLIIPDARLDDRFACNPFVQSEPGVRFYVGAPLLSHDGFNLGTLCLLDSQPRDPFTAEQQATLVDLAAMVVDELELRLAAQKIAQSEEEYRTLFESIDEGFCICEMLFDEHGKPHDYRFLKVNPTFAKLTGLESAVGKTARQLVPDLENDWVEIYGSVVQTGKSVRFEQQSIALNRWFNVNAFCVNEPQNHQFAILFTNISEAKRVEDERKKVEQEREQFFAVASDLQVITRTDGYFQWVSPTFERLLGWKPDEITSRPWTDFVHPDDINPSVLETDSLFSGNETLAFENRYRHKDGSYRWLLWRAKPQLEEQVIYGAAIDITDRKLAEVALRESEEHFRTLADNISQFAWMADANGWIFWYNRRWFEYTGTTLEQMQGWGWQQVHHPDYVDRVVKYVRRCFETGEHWEDTFPLRSKDGEYRWFLSRAIPIRDEAGTVLRWFGTNTDITDHKQAELEIQKFASLADSSTDFIGMCDLNFVPFYINEAGRKMIGLEDVQQYRETPVGEFFFPEDQDFILNSFFPRVLQDGQAEVEIRFRHFKTGEALWMTYNVFYLQDVNGQQIGLATVSHNITERKQVEAVRLRLAKEREQLLQREQAARETAERANRIKDEFLAVLSHELRSPLNPILGWTRLLQSGKLDATQQREALATIERNAKLQTQLIEDLLDISRIMQGKLSLTVAPVSLTFVITAAIETVRLAAEAKQIQILLDLTTAIAPVSGDAARLQQVIWNLLTNAVKFTPNGGQVTIELRQLDHLAQIRVIDSGKGINPQFLPHVFEYFRQADSTTTRKFGGLGLGLAIVRQIVKMHGGTVWAESEGENQGAIFTVQLPLSSQARSVETDAPHDSATTEAPLRNLQILLVDDETDARELQAFLLEQNGASVTAVASGFEALQALDQFIPNVLVSDVGMAEMDGYMLMQQIRSRPPNRGGKIPAIALTAYARDLDQQKALESGFQRHLSKPVEPEALVQAIVTLLKSTK